MGEAQNEREARCCITTRDRDTLLFDPAPGDMGPYVITYASNDQFNVWDETENGADAETFATFSKGIAEGATLTVTVDGNSRSSVNVFTRG